jgi:hypothetical protein
MRGKLRSYDVSILTIRDSQKISISEDLRIEGKTILSVTSCVCPIHALVKPKIIHACLQS